MTEPKPLSWDPASGFLKPEPLQFDPPRYDYDYGYTYPGRHRAERPWRFVIWFLVGQWFAIFGLVLALIWGWEW